MLNYQGACYMKLIYKEIIGNQINKKAERLYNIIGNKPGFNIIDAVCTLGGKVTFDDNGRLPFGIDAQIIPKNEEDDCTFEIVCAPNKTMEDTRFCIAHELGHLFLHMIEKDQNGNFYLTEKSFNKNNNFSNICEWEAEEFAACFLMPEEAFRNSIDIECGDVEKISEIFKVFPQSVIIRCKRLGIV